MKKALLFLILLMQLSFIKAQTYHPFPDSNAVWSNAYTHYSNIWIENYGLIGDTVFDSLQYHKIYLLHDSVLTIASAQYVGAIRESEKKVYYRYFTCPFEIVLYDFTKHINDTIFSLFSEDDLFQCLDSSFFYGVINEIDSTLIDGSYRKVFHFKDNTLTWIEGIGSTAGLFNPIDPQITGMNDWDLVCFTMDDEVLYHNPNFGSCYSSLSGIYDYSKGENLEIAISPNPFQSSATLQLPYNIKNGSIIFYDILGKKVKHLENLNGKEIIISREGMCNGMYFFKITEGNNIIGQGKLVIQ